MIYLDSSALVKRYFKEIGTDVVNSIVNSSKVKATSKRSCPEILSAFARKHRANEISHGLFQSAINRFESDWAQPYLIEFSDEMLQPIRQVTQKYPLRAADTVHLVSALWLRSSTKVDVTFVASDSRLLEAA
ncbi:MAG: type II toxin-antitoxin system VapC family toxin [Thermodesulfobacteriota bacterium]